MLNITWFVAPPLLLLTQFTADAAFQGRRCTSSDDQYESLLDGRCDIAITSMDNVFAWSRREGGGAFCVAGQIERTTRLNLVGRGEIHAIADLRGASILVDAPGNGFVVAMMAMLQDQGIAPGAYRLLQSGGVKERCDGLMAGQGDATLLGPPFDEVAVAAGHHRLATIQDAYPAFPGQGIVMREETLVRRKGELLAWMRQLDVARKHASTQPASAIEQLKVQGFVAAGAKTALENLPLSLRPDREGVELLIQHRKNLNLPGGEDSYQKIVCLDLLSYEVS